MTTAQRESTATTATKRKLTARDFVNVGIFTVLYFFVTFLGGCVGMVSPAMMLAGFAVAIAVDGTIIMLYLAKTPIFGAMTTLGLILGILMVLTGHFWGTVVLTTLLGLAADAIAASGNYRSRVRNIIGYGVSTAWFIGPFLPIFINSDAYFKQMDQQMGADYSASMAQLFTPGVTVLFALVGVAIGLLGGWIGTRLIDKHFAKAGMVA